VHQLLVAQKRARDRGLAFLRLLLLSICDGNLGLLLASGGGLDGRCLLSIDRLLRGLCGRRDGREGAVCVILEPQDVSKTQH
jgi:hypothetical protein